MQYVYGPIPSRRLGRSLGVDPIPLKTCNWNCVYCQLGRTSPLINDRSEWAPREAILADVRAAVAAHPPGSIEYISFVGSGEPTLHSGLGAMIRAVKQETALPVAVITNGALLGDPAVRADLLAADVVMPTLCAGDETLFRRIHRPHPDLTLAAMLDGLATFRASFTGQLWVEVMLLTGLNDDADALAALARAIERVRPDQVHLVLPERPATEAWVGLPDTETIMRATAILGAVAAVAPPAGAVFDLSGHGSLDEAVVAILQRHPMSEEQLAQALATSDPADAAGLTARLACDGRVRVVTRHDVRFWTSAEQRFEPAWVTNGAADQTDSLSHGPNSPLC